MPWWESLSSRWAGSVREQISCLCSQAYLARLPLGPTPMLQGAGVTAEPECLYMLHNVDCYLQQTVLQCNVVQVPHMCHC